MYKFWEIISRVRWCNKNGTQYLVSNANDEFDGSIGREDASYAISTSSIDKLSTHKPLTVNKNRLEEQQCGASRKKKNK